MNASVWSSGMIPASGAGGPGFESRNGPEVSLDANELNYTSVFVPPILRSSGV